MTYGYATYRPDTSVITSTDRSGSMVFIEMLPLPAGGSSSKSYPLVANGGLVVQQSSPSSHTITIDTDASGNPRLNWTATAGNSGTTLAVMATKLTASSSSYGISVANAAGQVFVSSDYPAPQLVGYSDPATTADTNGAVADGYTMYTHRATVASYAAARFIVMGIPDSGTDDTWYATDVSSLAANQSYAVSVMVFTKAATYKLPRLFVFAINGPAIASSGYGIQVFTPSHSLLYDAGAENMALMDVVSVAYAAYPGTVTYTPNLGAAVYTGIVFPGSFWNANDGTFDTGGYGACKKVGGQITFRLMQTYHTRPVAGDPAKVSDPTSGLFCAVVDLTYLGYSVGSGAGGGTSQSAPSITSQPSSRSVTAGTAVSFSVTATGAPAPTYQWYRNGVAISGATASSYGFTTSTGDNGATFYCRVSNSFGTVQSNTVSLSVSAAGGGTTPVSITSNPSSQTVAAGALASFSVAASGTAPITYQWRRGGTNISGATGSTYSFTAANGDNGATFDCVASNGGGAYSTISGSATLTVTQASPNAPVISQQPTSVTANQSQVVYMTCAASPATQYDWYLNGTYIGSGSSIQASTSTQGTFSYYCIVSNGTATTQSSTAILTVTGPSSSPYQSYNDFSTEIDAVDNPAPFAIYRNGSSDGSPNGWANGTGDGTLYTVRATGNFTPAPGSSALNTTYDFASVSGVSWIAPRPASTRPGVSTTYSLTVSVTLKGSGVVASSTIALVSTNSGTAA